MEEIRKKLEDIYRILNSDGLTGKKGDIPGKLTDS